MGSVHTRYLALGAYRNDAWTPRTVVSLGTRSGIETSFIVLLRSDGILAAVCEMRDSLENEPSSILQSNR